MSTRSNWCNIHRGPTDRAIAVAVIEVNSGPGGTVWSCPDCVARHRIVPLAEQSPDHPASRIQYRDRPPARGPAGAGPPPPARADAEPDGTGAPQQAGHRA
ncbi:hypothetical protein [Streptomyces sp. NPDC057702]|uniref:hypothetical protein n=1 Tax=unclassified Streptomyces TaxID=2593676 RepID=UPI0036981A57